MKIYTKKGDAGETGLIGGKRVPKDQHRLRIYGGLDELNCILGMALAEEETPTDVGARICRIQSELFQLGCEMATPREQDCKVTLLDAKSVEWLETEIDEMEKVVPRLRNFILPGGSRVGATIHLARAVCRRVERELIPLHRAEPVRDNVLKYVNRLSDYLFVLARYENARVKHEEVMWKGC